MKLWIFVFSAALFAGGTCLGVALRPKLARGGAAPSGEPEGWHRYSEQFSVQRFAEELDLTEEQDRQLDLILGETRRDIEAYGRAMRDAHQRSRDRVLAILTPEQKEKLERLMAEERERRSRADAERRVAALRQLLELSEEQARAVEAAFAAGRARKREFFEVRKTGGDPGQVRVFFRSLREEQNRDIEKVLTPEQYRKYLEIQRYHD
ncbi:MAG TPA: hypothetical protein VNO22_11115 [Planctomycetota bacterium]|nr:hypothetical protein [Planctomycetota bacterium]